jgi:hypothetical protein
MSDIHISMESHPLREVWEEIIDLRKNQVSLQEEINGITTELDQVATDIASVQTTLQTEIDNLAAANPGVDLSGLRTAVQPLDAAVQALGKLEPTPAIPPAEAAPVTPGEPVISTGGEQQGEVNPGETAPVAESPPTV